MKCLKWFLVFVLAVAGTLYTAGLARADISNATASNIQDGSNRNTSSQSGKGKTGAAVGGQVAGVVSSGRASVDAKNTSKDSDVTSGDVTGSNTSGSFTGLNRTGSGNVNISDITGSCNGTPTSCNNVQDGSNRASLSQTANATTGDGVAGQVVGVVTSRGSASVVASNTSTDSSVETGDARVDNDSGAFVGLNRTSDGDLNIADITGSCTGPSNGGTKCNNVQDGSNRLNSNQTANSATGDGIAGQVIGVVSGGAASVDASNTSDGVDVTTGEGRSSNDQAAFVGLSRTSDGNVSLSDVTDSCTGSASFAVCNNVQDGSNRASLSQSANSTSGDGVAGEVIGVVTSAGGSASVVAANHTKDSSVETGDARSENDLSAFIGLSRTSDGDLTLSDITGSCPGPGTACNNIQNGSNRLTGGQTANAATGDGVAGQVLGVVAGGATSLDANNTTTDSDVTSGDGTATNDAGLFVGLNRTADGNVNITDISGASADNLQDGQNSKTFHQAASATSGDAVAGQVSGVVTSAGGSASVVLANTSNSIDSTSGESHFSNDDAGFVGLNTSPTLDLG